MTKVHSKALDQSIEVERIIGHLQGEEPGPTVVFIGGIHGNEPAGIFALLRVFEEMRKKNIHIKGHVYALSGNLWALERGERYHQQDLNRLWTSDKMNGLLDGNLELWNEDISQQVDIYKTIKKILAAESGPFYFLDLHTTSGETIPFLTVNDSLLNRKVALQYPVPIILGIEEYLEGPLLSYINELGFVAFGFEGGQHDDLSSIENHISFIYLSLLIAGVIDRTNIDYNRHFELLARNTFGRQHIYEINSRYEVKEAEKFTMKPGFTNFQWVLKGEEIAISNGEKVCASGRGQILMPRYQVQGNDGFFFIRRISPFFLTLSASLRKIRFDRVLPLLPGIRWTSGKRDELVVNRKVAWLFTKKFFHLLGYRSRQVGETHLLVKHREAVSLNGSFKKHD
ncbi:MAG: succinylglutamate desuccinylase/aspartoacylase family protein [Cyclobacteriaceae bacterium]|nr:succinylglutamate desuccinylase/aspartoacylase family protein [Cyclobacteriaceae bacterium]MDH5249455.1 succinylglutamate desuccinylase/aspartoacylase family protein [Cyclobacteriaceae bacterium]